MKKLIAFMISAALFLSCFPAGVAAAEESCVYEAESAYTGGWAVRLEDGAASAGALVTHVGGTNTDNGTVVFDVWADQAGSYDCEIAYRSRNNSSFYIRVNQDGWDTSRDERVVTTAGNGIVTAVRKLSLKQGWNTVKVYSTEGIEKSGGRITKDKRIDVDKLTVHTKGWAPAGIVEDTVSGKGTARQAFLAKDQSVTKNAEFEVIAEADGVYDLNIWYAAADFRAMELYVDGQLADTLLCPITAEDYNIETVSTKLTLRGGVHRISFENRTALAPEIDKIQLVRSENVIQEPVSSGTREFSNGQVSVRYDMASGKADYISDGTVRVKGFEAAVKVEQAKDSGNGNLIHSVVKSSDYTQRRVEENILSDGFGMGKRYDVVSTAPGLPELRQSFYLYNELDYILTSVTISNTDGVSTNFLAPIAATGQDVVDIGEKTDAKSLCVPFSNDDYSTYDPQSLKGNHTSYWVTCLFDNNTRNAVVAGSVDHDTWKTGTSTYGTADNGSVNFFGAFAGIWSRKQTYDFLPHGSLSGTSVSSPKMFLGYFDDWRDGMETYGDANNKNQPRLFWGGGNIFGYNSWNAYGSSVNLDSMKTASDVVDGLETFHDENGIQWINVDSYWDNMTQNNDESKLKEYVAYCKAKGQKVGMYTARYICWDDDLWGWGKRGYAITDKHGNVVAPAKQDGTNLTTIDCFAFDPTSEQAKADTRYWMEHWKELGFEFLKVDFINFSAVEGVYQDPNIKTGLQAYNAACQEIAKYVDTDKFFLSYSMAPLFPYQYAHGRRLSCDIGTEKSNMNEAKYMLNTLNYSWWQAGTVYEYVDPDQVSFDIGLLTGNEERARAKYTSCVIAGMLLLSNRYETAKAKSLTKAVAENEAVNKIARLGRAFRPVEATGSCPYKNAADPSDTFTLETEDSFYIAVFNYGGSKTSKTLDFVRLGLEKDVKYQLNELWTGTTQEGETTFDTGTMAAYTCKLYQIPLDGENGSKDILQYTEDFESGTVEEDIINQANGWTHSEGEGAHFQVGGYDFTGNSTNVFRQATSEWWTSHTSALDLYKSGVHKRTEAGLDRAQAEEEVSAYLSNNLSVSFQANFSAPDPDEAGESGITIKDDTGNSLLTIACQRIEGTANGRLVLKDVLNESKTGAAQYTILEGAYPENNTIWYKVQIDFDLEHRMFRLRVNGKVFETPFGAWTPIGNPEKNGVLERLDQVERLEFSIQEGAWWQSMYLDDIQVSTITEGAEEPFAITRARIVNEKNQTDLYGGDKIYPVIEAGEGAAADYMMGYSTNSGKTYISINEGEVLPLDADTVMLAATARKDGKTAERTAYIPVGKDDNTFEHETFDEGERIATEAAAGSALWNLTGDAEKIVQYSGWDSDPCIRFAATEWWKQTWLEHSFLNAEIQRLEGQGAEHQEAVDEAEKNLSNHPVVSFRARFENASPSQGAVHEGHIRIYNTQGAVIASLVEEFDRERGDRSKLYLVALNESKTVNEKVFVADIDKDAWYDFQFEFDTATDRFRFSFNGTAVPTAHGEWTEVSSAGAGDDGQVGAAVPATVGIVDKIQFGIYWSAWWQTMYLDDLKIAPAEYPVTVNLTGGEVFCTRGKKSADTAAAGNRVTVSLMPSEGYLPGTEELRAQTEAGTEISLTSLGDGRYSFIMPPSPVILTGGFEKEEHQWAVRDMGVNPATGAFNLIVSSGGNPGAGVRIITALYQGDRLEDVKIFTDPVFDEQDCFRGSGQFILPKEAEHPLRIKVFFWKEQMKPEAGAVFEKFLSS